MDVLSDTARRLTYRSRGRSLIEVVLALCFVVFLVGFISVLCIGNYFRAKRAQERQRQRRLAKMAAANNQMAGQHGMYAQDGASYAPSYEAPTPISGAGGVPA